MRSPTAVDGTLVASCSTTSIVASPDPDARHSDPTGIFPQLPADKRAIKFDALLFSMLNDARSALSINAIGADFKYRYDQKVEKGLALLFYYFRFP